MPARSRTYPEINKAFSEVLRVKEGLPSDLSRREQVEVLIGACIVQEFDTRELIIKWLRVAGRTPNAIAKVLDERTGPSTDKHFWQLGEDGRYTLHDLATTTEPARMLPGAVDLSFMDAVK